ncbi:hypothetical protein KY285_001972 [Solanum tuberosum]|nr:hypothetical protein KY285_001972 [Solanum tuberosum]
MCALAEIWLGLTSLPEVRAAGERGRGWSSPSFAPVHRSFELLAGVGTWGRLGGGDLIVSFELDGLLRWDCGGSLVVFGWRYGGVGKLLSCLVGKEVGFHQNFARNDKVRVARRGLGSGLEKKWEGKNGGFRAVRAWPESGGGGAGKFINSETLL